MHSSKHTFNSAASQASFQSHTWFCSSSKDVICWGYSHTYSNLLLDTVRPLAITAGWHCNFLLLWLPSIPGPAPDPSATCNTYMYMQQVSLNTHTFPNFAQEGASTKPQGWKNNWEGALIKTGKQLPRPRGGGVNPKGEGGESPSEMC